MNMLQRLSLRLRALFRRRQIDGELDEELRFHIERQTEANIEAGVKPEEARYAALRKFGWTENIKETCRDVRGVNAIENALKDVRFGLRMLVKRPGFTAMAVMSLAVGIGLNSTLFSLLDAAFLRPIPFKDPEKIVRVNSPLFCYPDYRELSAQCHSLSGVVAVTEHNGALRKQEGVEMVQGELVSPNYFSVLGIGAAVGNVFSEQDSRLRSDPVAVVSYRLWQRLFNGDSAIVGKTIQLDGRDFTILGVVQKGYSGVRNPIKKDVWVPAQTAPRMLEDREDRVFSLLGRRAPTVSQAQVQAEVETFVNRLGLKDPSTGRPERVVVWSETQSKMDRGGKMSVFVMMLAGLVLLIACANVSGMLLARNEERRREMAVRLALGAGRWRLMRQLLIESLLLATLAAVCGLLLTAWGKGALLALFPPSLLQYAPEPRLDYRVVGLTLVLIVLVTIVFGLAPAWRAAKTNLATILKGEAALGGSGVRRLRGRNALVVGQIAVSVAFLVTAGLFVRGFQRGLAMDLGFPEREMLYLFVDPALDGVQSRPYFGQLTERVRALSGVNQVSLASRAPLSLAGGNGTQKVFLPGDETLANAEGRAAGYEVVETNFFQTMGIRLQRGRSFDKRDDESGARVVIISEGMARRYWPGEDPLGRPIRLGSPQAPPVEIVGVARDVVRNKIGEVPEPFLYLPFGQHIPGAMTLLVETKGNASAVPGLIRREMRLLNDKVLPLLVQTEKETVRIALWAQWTLAWLMAGLGLAAFALAAAGLYGLVSYSVARRTHEIGIRMALGAQTGDTLRMILRQGLVLALLGLGIGLPAAFLLGRVLQGMLFGLSPADPATILGSSLLVIAVAVLAGYFPARRAIRIDPMTALRCE